MIRLALLAALCVGIPLCADDPPKKLTSEERKELEAKWGEAMAAAGKARQSGRADEAIKALENGLRLARRLYPVAEFPNGHANLATSLNNLAFLLHSQAKFAEAELHFREALDMRKRLLKGDHPDVADSLSNLAAVLDSQGKLADAERLLRAALEMNRRLFKGDHPSIATGLHNLAASLDSLGRFNDAELLYRDALAMNRRLFKGDHPELAMNLNNLAGVLRDQGKLTDAEILLRDSLDMNRRLFKGDHLYLAGSLNNLAGILDAQGRPAEAEPLYRDAMNMLKRLFKGDHPHIAGSLNNLAAALDSQGKLADAEPFYREALDMYRQLFKGDHPSVAVTLNNLALLLHAQEKFSDAEMCYGDALAMNRRLFKGDHPIVAQNLNNLAALLKTQGKLADAEGMYRDSLEMYRRLFPGDHPTVALSLNNLAFLLKAQGRLADAATNYRDAIGMYHRLIESYAQHKTEGETLTLLTSLPLTRDGLLSVARETNADPVAVYPVIWSSKAAVARVYERRLQAARAVADPRVARMLGELADARRHRAELLLAPKTGDAATRKQREDELATRENQVRDLDRAIRSLLPAVARAERLTRATPADLQKALPANTALVDFLDYTFFECDRRKPGKAGEKRTAWYLAFIVTKDRVAWVDLAPAGEVETAVIEWRDALTSGKPIPHEIPTKVRELVWEKVRKELPANIKTVYIAPDQVLCRVPWGALPGDKPGTVLLEDFAVATIPHAPFLLDKLWPQDPIKNPPTSALVVGGVNFDAEATTGPADRGLPIKPDTKIGWQALPGAAAEATGVENAAKKKVPVTALKGEAATPVAVLAALPKVKYAHFATHGFFADPSFRSAFQLDEKDFLESRRGERIGRAALSPLVMTGLVFAGANNPKTTGRGIVTGEALVDLDLSGLELAVLSACETGLGDVAGGEGTFGLQRAFHLAGTRDVVASLWKVPDAPTAALMAEFYRNLWTQNLSPMESLRQAQLTIYRNPGKIAELAASFRAGFKEVKGDETDLKPTADGKAHPRRWAAFTLSGPGR